MVSTVSDPNHTWSHFWPIVTWRMEEDGQYFRDVGMEKLTSEGLYEEKVAHVHYVGKL